MPFELHPAIERDSHLICREGDIQIRLQNHAVVPWLVLVPEQAGARELHELAPELRRQLTEQQDRVSRILLDQLHAEKLNTAAIGNVVPQLHLHCIGRFNSDPYWPGVIWGHPLKAYDDPDAALCRWRAWLGVDATG